MRGARSLVGLGFFEADDALAILELPALFEQFDALETLEHVALGFDRALTAKTSVLTHRTRDNSGPPSGCNANPLAASAEPAKKKCAGAGPEADGGAEDGEPHGDAGGLPVLSFLFAGAHGSSSWRLKWPRTKR